MTFFKTFWAALFAFIIGGLVLSMVGVLFVVGTITALSFKSPTVVEPNSILKIDFKQNIVESSELSPMNAIDFTSFKVNDNLSLLSVLTSVERAGVDDNIKGIYLDMTTLPSMSYATAEELRGALLKFKQTGKFIVAYSEFYTQGAYYLASVADKVFVNPEGEFQWRGLAMNQIFYKGLLDKLGVEPIVLRSGSFKAAVEPFVNSKMSAENKCQSQLLIYAFWDTMLESISSSRGVEAADLKKYASDLTIVEPEDALKYNLVDQLMYVDEVSEALEDFVGEDDKDLKFVNMTAYAKQTKQRMKASDNKVAVVYIDGDIISGKSKDGSVGSETIRKKIANLREDDDIKALVLRVNSPGGSALASEVMWRELALLKQEIPVVVSMGGMAASGGYYVAAPADAIFANKMTITGSIGVFGLLFNAQKGLSDKLGITSDVVKTNPYADMGSIYRSPNTAERDFGVKQVEKVYETFVSHVAQGRNLTVEDVKKVAEGRVWAGLDAKDKGLVDGFGSLTDAILLAADRASIGDDFEIYELVNDEDTFTVFLNSLSASIKNAHFKGELQESFEVYERVQTILKTKGVQAVTPYIYEIQ